MRAESCSGGTDSPPSMRTRLLRRPTASRSRVASSSLTPCTAPPATAVLPATTPFVEVVAKTVEFAQILSV